LALNLTTRVKKNTVLYLVLGFLLASAVFITTGAGLYLTSTGDFCGSCHVMDEQYTTWQQSTHKQFTCVECHLPHNYPDKLIEKTKTGLRDIYEVTFDKVPEVIKLTTGGQEILDENCIRCHSSTVETLMNTDRSCFECHLLLSTIDHRL